MALAKRHADEPLDSQSQAPEAGGAELTPDSLHLSVPLATQRAPSRSRADTMQDTGVGRPEGQRSFRPALIRRATHDSIRLTPLSALVALWLRLTSDDPSVYEDKWLSRRGSNEELHVGMPRVHSFDSMDSARVDSARMDSARDNDGWIDVDLAEFAMSTLSDLPMPCRPKHISVPNGATVPSSTCAPSEIGRSMSLPRRAPSHTNRDPIPDF